MKQEAVLPAIPLAGVKPAAGAAGGREPAGLVWLAFLVACYNTVVMALGAGIGLAVTTLGVWPAVGLGLGASVALLVLVFGCWLLAEGGQDEYGDDA